MAEIGSEQIGQLLQQYGPALVLYARNWCVHPDDALQEALIDLAHLSPPPRDPPAWLFAAVRHKALNIARAEQRCSWHERRAASEREAWFQEEPGQPIVAREVQQALAQLPDLERQIVIARIWGELSFAQIAQVVDKPSSSVHRRYGEALRRLSTLLGETVPNQQDVRP